MSVKFDNRREMFGGKIVTPQLIANSPHITKIHPIMGAVVLPWHAGCSLSIASHGEGQKLWRESEAFRSLSMDLLSHVKCIQQLYTVIHSCAHLES